MVGHNKNLTQNHDKFVARQKVSNIFFRNNDNFATFAHRKGYG